MTGKPMPWSLSDRYLRCIVPKPHPSQFFPVWNLAVNKNNVHVLSRPLSAPRSMTVHHRLIRIFRSLSTPKKPRRERKTNCPRRAELVRSPPGETIIHHDIDAIHRQTLLRHLFSSAGQHTHSFLLTRGHRRSGLA